MEPQKSPNTQRNIILIIILAIVIGIISYFAMNNNSTQTTPIDDQQVQDPANIPDNTQADPSQTVPVDPSQVSPTDPSQSAPVDPNGSASAINSLDTNANIESTMNTGVDTSDTQALSDVQNSYATQ